MRLLKYENDGEFSLTQDITDNIPRYAILSHTWGAEEVTFRDMVDGKGKSKAGYEKIRFCGEQARRDGLQYFWVDTCCIDKSSSAELSEAINSMFRWYRESTRCYVYLSDVLRTTANSDDPTWESAFRKSRWFTRGWTLQELIAPTSVEFFSKEKELLGDKTSLERHVCEITKIPAKAFRESPLTGFSIAERMSWAEQRETTREEDQVYSLLGIFDISIPVIYGEGKRKATKRLREEIDKALKGVKREDFSVAFSLSDIPNIEHFVARKKELAEMNKTLSGDGSRRTVVLHGLGGIGKTQLAVAYAKQHKDNYSAVFWLNIKDKNSLMQSFVKIAKQISREHPTVSWLSNVATKENLDEVVDAVKAWLSLPSNTRWLIIYDNYDNPKIAGNTDPNSVDIYTFLPESHQGSIIITTRSSQVELGCCIQIRKLGNVGDSLVILSSVSRRQELVNDPDAVKLAEELDGFPLALATAGAYLNQTSISFSDYLRLYKESWAKLQKRSPVLGSYKDRTLHSTWQISFYYVEQRNPLSAKLLCLWAYFDNQDLWFELLRHSDSADPEWIRELTEDELSFHDAMRVLSNHGLVEVAKSSEEWGESKGYSIHECVHLWTVHALNQEWDSDLARLAVKFVGAHVPGVEDVRPWLIQRRLLQHAARCSFIAMKGMIADDGIEWAYHQLGLLYADQGKLAEAQSIYERALAGKEKALGTEHTSTLDTVNNLGILYKAQGKLAKAQSMYERALAGYEKALGAEHTSTLVTVNNLGLLYKAQGKLAEAQSMYERALAGYEKALGAEHTSTLDTVNNLGLLYEAQGRLAEAQSMYERALAGKEKALGAEHTSTLDTVNNLGLLYKAQGKLADAQSMYERALAGYEKALGAEHTSTLGTVNNLGVLYEAQGKLADAQSMYERALAGKEKALGAEHTSTLNTVNNLGVLYKAQGRLTEAQSMYERALAGYEKALGAEHTSTLVTVNNLGLLYKAQGKLADAQSMYERALAGKEKALGAEHTSTLVTVNSLGLLYKAQGRFAEAQSMYKRALAGYEKALGAEHTSTLGTVNNLGLLYEAQGKLADAQSMYERALAGKEKALGAEHTSTLGTVNNLGLLYKAQGKLAKAEQMYERALAGYEKALGADNVTTYMPALNTVWSLGSLFENKNDFANARMMYSKALAGFEKVVGPDHQSSRNLQNKLRALDSLKENSALVGMEEPMNNSQEGLSRLGAEGTRQNSKGYKPLKKRRLR
ncbi:hypothetical protein B0O99DRAFT_155706 [Bisporella sp. PMI_857]|nr:hypothetical protein B0O99DRAFT_155706 [Bisporella sp. PMI_857]